MDYEYDDITYTVTLDLRADASVPTEGELRRAIYQAVEGLDAESCVLVERQ